MTTSSFFGFAEDLAIFADSLSEEEIIEYEIDDRMMLTLNAIASSLGIKLMSREDVMKALGGSYEE